MTVQARKYAPVQFYFGILRCEEAGRLSEGSAASVMFPLKRSTDLITSKAYMRGIAPRCIAAVFCACVVVSAATQSGSPDPAFATVPFEQWIKEGDKDHIRWSAHVLPVELSNHQRLFAKVEAVIDGKEFEQRRGHGRLAILIQFNDSENRVYQTHKSFDLDQVEEGAGKLNITYTQGAFVTPGDYRISLAVFDTNTGQHSALRLPLHVIPLKNDPLPNSWRDLPPVEIPQSTDAPDNLYLPEITSKLYLPLGNEHPVRIELLVNASPISGDDYSRPRQVGNRTLASVIPSLKVISQCDIRNGMLNVAMLDLTTQQVIFRQDAVHDLDWGRLGPALQQAGPNVIDVHALENRKENPQFFVNEVRKRIDDSAANSGRPAPVVIVLSGPMSFGSGADLHPIELERKKDVKVFYIRFHSIPPRPAMDPFMGGARRGRRMGPYGRTQWSSEAVDSLEQTLKPLRPHLFDVTTPEDFRKALRDLINAIAAV